ncbi:uncharacterized protein DUF5074 [Chitinophaga dinghuensis]|uniref:Uncharacterized protein DUF5074 n=1 Tax=Chitinophaga dinghuensis TaxID=1539050 RepID=A0A327VSW8_9BACT|nr:DUF5074 domain-containing protein [Chitinophaga dinghuensis]RAJ79141.1 uncharacterized protein DUF5074 [Chitinophaga dinghuensis]
MKKTVRVMQVLRHINFRSSQLKRLYGALFLAATLTMASCKKEDKIATPPSKYNNGFFVANEGWFGHETGDAHFYSYSGDSLTWNVYKTSNPGDSLGSAGNSLEFATIFNNKMYFVVKAGGPLVAADLNTMKVYLRNNSLPKNDGHAFAGIDQYRGLLTTGDGVYPVSLSTLAIDKKIDSISGYTGDVIVAGKYAFALSQTDGIVAFNTADYKFAKRFGKANQGFARAKDGDVYAATADSMVRINPNTLERSTVNLGFKVASPWGAWRHASICASTKENAIFIAPGSGFSGGTKAYRYVIGDASSLAQPFITLPTGQYFYGSAIGYNKATNELIALTVNGSITGNINRILFYDATSGELKKTVTYNGWFFPAMPVFMP